MKRIRLDRESKRIRCFVRSLPVENGGAVLELWGKPLLRVVSVDDAVDRAKLKAAILGRRNASRRVHDEWRAVDRESWDRIPDSRE